MASPASRLLTLPREIRNHLYSYLPHEKELRFGWQSTVHTTYGAIAMHVENAPPLNLLLTHPQLHNEYLEVENLSARFRPLPCFVLNFHISEPALARLQQVDLSIKQAKAPHHKPWAVIEDFVEWLSLKSPHISTIRVAILEELPQEMEVHRRELDNNTMTTAFRDGNVFLPSPPGSLIKLPLRRCGQGYRYAYSTSFQLQPANSSKEEFHYHNIYKSGAWLFSSKTEHKHWDPARELPANWPLRGYPADVLDRLPQGDLEKAVRMGREMQEWKELAVEAAT
ncbi:hypothetical protein BKA66DRAFT_274943 [Pyrenochaeta sp. MPI-SDFR-AT-0127]|nr:hypothetical protein BKA66DRAFT_274943 [Pyrenochaeta sp. MPI-SDFR-AT-0127]